MLESPITFNGITLQDQAVQDAAFEASPYYFVEVTNIDDIVDILTEEHKIPGSIGVRSGDVLSGGRTLTFSGFVWGWNLDYMRQGQWALRQALADRADHPLAFTLWNEPQLYITCHTLQDVHFVEAQADDKMRRSYTFSLRADDPRTYQVSDDSLYPTWQSSMA